MSLERLLLLIALIAALTVGGLLGRRHRISLESAITQMLLWGCNGSRTGFVMLYLEDYLAQTIGILDIRDGGFSLAPALIAVVALGAFHGWRNQPIRRPLGAAVV